MSQTPPPSPTWATSPSTSGIEQHPVAPTASAGSSVGPLAVEVVAVALGVALISAAAVLASIRARADGDLDWSNFVLGVAAALGLLAVAAAARVLVKDPLGEGNLFAWPGAFGTLAAGLILATAIDEAWAAYPSGIAIVILSVGGYLLSSRPAFVVSAIVGLLVIYLKITEDLFSTLDLEGSNAGLTVGAVVLVFTVLVTAAGWLLPTRVYSGVVAGMIATVSYVTVLFGLLIAASFASAFGQVGSGSDRDSYHDDVWWILFFSLVLIALWAFCAWVTGHVGFRLLMVALTVLVVPLATTALGVEHPTWWEVVLGLIGGALLLAVAFRAHGRLSTPMAAPAAPQVSPGDRT